MGGGGFGCEGVREGEREREGSVWMWKVDVSNSTRPN